MLTSICLTTYNRTEHLIKTLQAIAQHARQPYEVVAVDDASTNKDVPQLLLHFKKQFEAMGVPFHLHINEQNLGYSKTCNKSWRMAQGDVIFRIEDDILVPHDGWNQIMASFLDSHPEVGQIAPDGSGRGEWIVRESATGGYREFAWALGGFFGIRRKVYEQVGGWDEDLAHQIEPDYNLQVRMAGWRLAETPGIRMIHLGEGEHQDTFKRQAQITVGVHQMLMKWNTRFQGWFDYDSLFAMSWDDFPPNVNFRRQLAAWYAAEAKKLEERYRGLGVLKDDPNYANAVPAEVRKVHDALMAHRLNKEPQPFKYYGHWGAYELVKVIRPCGREREEELITLMKNNHAFGGVRRIEHQLRELAKRMNYDLSEQELVDLAKKVPTRIRWEPIRIHQ